MMRLLWTAKATLLAVISIASISTGYAESFTFWHGASGKLGEAIQDICKKYNESQKNNVITCISQGSNEALMQKTIAAYRAKLTPEIILGFDAGTLDLMLSQAIYPVEELANQYGVSVDWKGYLPAVRSYYEGNNGKLYGQPFNASTVLLFSNMKQLNAAGVAKPPETWEEFEEVAGKLKASGNLCPFVTDGHPWRFLEQYSAVSGEPIASMGNGYRSLNAEYVFDQTSHRRIMNDLVSWRRQGLVKLSPDTRAGNYTAAFTSGECAMMLNSSAAYGQAFLSLKDVTPIVVTKMPIFRDTLRHNTTVGGGAIWVMKGHSEEKYRAVLDFLNYVRRPEVQKLYVKRTGYLPVTKSAYEYITQSTESQTEEFATVKVSIESLSAPANENTKGVRLGFYVQFRQIWIEETQRAMTGKQSMDTALLNARVRGNKLLQRFARTYKNVALP